MAYRFFLIPVRSPAVELSITHNFANPLSAGTYDLCSDVHKASQVLEGTAFTMTSLELWVMDSPPRRPVHWLGYG